MRDNNSNINYSATALVMTGCLFAILSPFYFIWNFFSNSIKSKRQDEEKIRQLLLKNLEEERLEEESKRIKKEIEEKLNIKIQEVQKQFPYYSREQALEYIKLVDSI